MLAHSMLMSATWMTILIKERDNCFDLNSTCTDCFRIHLISLCVCFIFFPNRHYCRHQTAVSLMPRIHHTHAYREWETHSHFDFDTKKENEKSINAFNRVRFLVHSKPIWNVNQVCFVIHSWNKNAKSVFACPSPPFGNHLYACMCVDVCVL